MKWAIPVLASILILGSLGLSQQAFAEFATIDPSNAISHCDDLFAPTEVDEIGQGLLTGAAIDFPFPDFEELTSGGPFPVSPSCISAKLGGVDVGIFITNEVVPPTAFPFVWYIADIDTSITNYDGFADIGMNFMFLIDSPDSFGGGGCGVNCPLVSESMTSDGIWEPGETWGIVLQDFFSPSTPEFLNSIGVGFLSTGSTPGMSSGSIVVEPFGGFFGPVGGTVLPIDSTALLVTGVYTTASWMIPVIVSAVGIGLAVFTLKRNR